MILDIDDLEWELEAARLVASLILPLQRLQATPDEESDALWEAVDDIDTATTAGLHWSRSHPGSDPDLARHVKRLFASQSLALSSVGVAMRRPRQGGRNVGLQDRDIEESMVAVGQSLAFLRDRLPIP
jgi:hypothetical protein